jgi:hypothetical protein
VKKLGGRQDKWKPEDLFLKRQNLAEKTIEHRQSGHDSDDFVASVLPGEFAKPYLG